MTKFYLIRHAEAEGNLYRRPHGHYDSNITLLGRRQVAALAERFRDVPVDALWSSDLIRTRSTASAIVKYHPNLTMHTSAALREVDVGCWEDRTWGEIARTDPEQYRSFNQDPADWRVPGGEPYTHLVERLKNALLELAGTYPGKTVAVVSHAYAIRALAAFLMKKPFGDIPFGDNTAVTTVTAENGALTLESYADGSHLGSLSTFAHQGLADDHRGKKADGWFAPLVLPEETNYYCHAYSDTWMASHGDLTGYAPVVYLRAAARRSEQDPQCLVKLLYGQEPVGVVELDPERGAKEKAGWISLVWVDPVWRGRRFGAQLIGHAVSRFRHMGRDKLWLHVSRTNGAAIRFYEAMGFQRAGISQGVGGPLYLMEMDIEPRVWCLP